MPSASELGNVMVQALSSVFKALGDFMVLLRYTGNNETAVNASRGAYQSFWETWYYSGAVVSWFRKLILDGYVREINRNSTLEAKYSKLFVIAANNSTHILGDPAGKEGLTYLLRITTSNVSSEFVCNFWYMAKHAIVLAADALKQVPIFFPG